PLASIMGATTSLLLQRNKLTQQEQDRLLGSIVGESEYLTAVTENTLQLARLSDATQIHRDWESMEEIVGAVLRRVRQRDPERRIQSRVAPGLPLIRADPVLLAQLLENLLDNALKYSAEAIELEVKLDDDKLQVCIGDRGQGIAEADELTMFEPFRRSDRSGQRGVGLGLAVCRAIATAHDGVLTARLRPGGGTSMRLSLPVESAQPGPELP
nr:ATP-binding protein [Pseudomonadota bacterium]